MISPYSGISGGSASNATIGPYAPKPLIPPAQPTTTAMPTSMAPAPTRTPVRTATAPKPLVPAAAPAGAATAYDGGTYGAVNGIDPVKVKATTLEGMQPYIDAAYNQSASRLDPQFAQMEARFQQDMVNKGIQPGTQAYDEAYANYSRSKNDAYASARNEAMGQGLAAQGQAWGQGMSQAQLAQAMQMYGLNRDQFDVNRFATLTGLDQSGFGLNQNADAQQFNMGQSLLGMIPGSNPTQIDTYSPYGLQANAINANNQVAASQQNGIWGAVGQLGAGLMAMPAGAAILCAIELKEPLAVADPMDSLRAVESLPLELWRYRDGEDRQTHIGTYAGDFNRALGLEDVPHINLIDMIGSLIGSVQALSAKVALLEKSHALRSD